MFGGLEGKEAMGGDMKKGGTRLIEWPIEQEPEAQASNPNEPRSYNSNLSRRSQ